MVTENNSQINSFTGGLDSDTMLSAVESNKYIYAENVRISTVDTTWTGSGNEISPKVGSITPIIGVENSLYENYILNFSELVKQILACGNIRDYGVIIYVGEDDTWNVATFKNTDDNNDIHKDISNLQTIFNSKAHTNLKKFSIEFCYEDEDVIKLYIADGEHPIILLNIANDSKGENHRYEEINKKDVPIDYVIAYPKIKYNPFVFDGLTSGILKPALVQYSYSLYNKNGISTEISPLTKLIPIVNERGGKNTVGYSSDVEHSDAGVLLKLTLDEEYVDVYNKIKVYRITYSENGQLPTIEIITDANLDDLNKTSNTDEQIIYSIIDRGTESLDIITVEEYNNKSGIHIIPTVIESHQNYMFAANVKTRGSFLKDSDLDKIQVTPYFVKIRLIGDGIYNEDHFRTTDATNRIPYKYGSEDCAVVVLNNENGYSLGPIKSKLVSNVNLEFFDVCIYDKDGRRENDNFLISKVESYLSQFIDNIKYLDYSDPFVTYYLKSLRRGETYRYGVVFYNKYGESSKVKYIDDILVPDIWKYGFETFVYQGNMDAGNIINNQTGINAGVQAICKNGNLYVFPLGLVFEVSGIPDDVVSYEIVRCNRGYSDTKNIYQGVISKPTQQQKYSENMYKQNLDDLTRQIDFYPYVPTGFISDQEYHNAAVFGGDLTNLNEIYKNESDSDREIYYNTNKYNKDLFLFICPEVCYLSETFLETLKTDSKKLTMQSFVYPLVRDILPRVLPTVTNETDQYAWNGYVPGYKRAHEMEEDEGAGEGVRQLVGLHSLNHNASLVVMRFNSIYVGIGLNMRVEADRTDNKYYFTANGSVENNLAQMWAYYTYAGVTLSNMQFAETYGLTLGPVDNGRPDYWGYMLPNDVSYEVSTAGDRNFPTQYVQLKKFLFSTVKLYANAPDLILGESSITRDNLTASIDSYAISTNLNWDEFITKNDDSGQTSSSTKYKAVFDNYRSSIGNHTFINATLGNTINITSLLSDPNGSSNDDNSPYYYDSFVSAGGPCALLTIDLTDDNYNSFMKQTDSSAMQIRKPLSPGIPGTQDVRIDSQNAAQRLLGTHICSISHSVVPYGGSSDYAKANSNYYSYSNFYDKNDSVAVVFDGDTFILPFEYVALHKMYSPMTKTTWFSRCNVYYIPLETSINLAYTYGNEISRNINADAISNVQINPSDVNEVYIQPNPLYLYNTAYSSNSTAKVFTGDVDDEDSNDLNNTDYRVYNSELKSNKESEDSWIKYQSSNFLDLETKHGLITELKSFNDNLMFWQDGAFGRLSVNDRSIVTDETNLPTILGVGGILDRYHYIDRTSGMYPEEYCVTQSPTSLYWFDDCHQELKAYRGEGVIPLDKQGRVRNIMQRYSDTGKNTSVMYDFQYNEVIFNVLEGMQLVYNEVLNTFTSLYTLEYTDSIVFSNRMYLVHTENNNLKIVQWNSSSDNKPKDLNGNVLNSTVRYVVNKNPLAVKTFDNQEIVTQSNIDILGLTIDESYFETSHEYSWKTELNESSTENLNITNREGNYRYSIPRKDDAKYGDRIKGKNMICTMTDKDPQRDVSISYIITKFRTSWI